MDNTMIMEILKPVLIAIATAVAGFIGAYGAKFLKEAIGWIKTKIGSETYNQALNVAKGIYVYLEDKYDLSGMGETKKKEMESMLLEKFPNLTQVELDAINKEVWLSFNEEWLKSKSKIKTKKSTTKERIDG